MWNESIQASKQGRLSCSRSADDSEALSYVEFVVDSLQRPRFNTLVLPPEVLDLEGDVTQYFSNRVNKAEKAFFEFARSLSPAVLVRSTSYGRTLSSSVTIAMFVLNSLLKVSVEKASG